MTHIYIIAATPLLGSTLLAAVGIFLAVTLLLVVILLVAKRFLVNSGDVRITLNGDKVITAPAGGSLLSTMAGQDIFFQPERISFWK